MPLGYGSKEDSLWQYGVLVPFETLYGETTWAIIWRFWSDAKKMGLSARPSPFGPSVPKNPTPNFDSALRASTFTSFSAFPRNHNPIIGSAVQASPFKRRKCPSPQFFTRSMSASRSRTCHTRLRPRQVFAVQHVYSQLPATVSKILCQPWIGIHMQQVHLTLLN